MGIDDAAPAAHWLAAAEDAAEAACRAFGLPGGYSVDIAALTLGIIETESSFGSGPRYVAKAVLGRIPWARSKLNAHGPAQCTLDRARYLARLAKSPQPTAASLQSPTGATAITALGVGKACALYTNSPRGLDAASARSIVLTHHAGFMSPQIAAIQIMLSTVSKRHIRPTGFADSATYASLNAFGSEFGCGYVSPPYLSHPEIAGGFFATPLGVALSDQVSRRTGQPPTQVVEPDYVVREFYTGSITSRGYADRATRIWTLRSIQGATHLQ